MDYCGYDFVIMTNGMTIRRRLFQSDELVNAKIFREFVALIIKNKIYTSLKDETLRNEKRANYIKVCTSHQRIEKIELIRQFNNSYSLNHAVTSKQKVILKAFGMDVKYIKENVGQTGVVLAPLK